jgi:MFS family permease
MIATSTARHDSTYAWTRLAAAFAVMTIGSVGWYSMSVALVPVEVEYGVTRSSASMAYAVTLVGFSIGTLVMGRIADRFGVFVPLLIGAPGIGAGYAIAGIASEYWLFLLTHGALIGVGMSATFVPMVTDTSLWFRRWRGLAVSICASGNFLAGAVWPPLLQTFFDRAGWRQSLVGLGAFCFIALLLLALAFRARPPADTAVRVTSESESSRIAAFNLTPSGVVALLSLASFACCVVMATPIVHIVAYCTDRGFAAARGAEMLSLMLGAGAITRVVYGAVSDRIGGLYTLLIGSVLQGAGMLLFVTEPSLAMLYLASGLFGAFQSGLIPAYAVIVREYFPAKEAATRISVVLTSSFVGMAVGGWLSGLMFDVTASYRSAFASTLFWSVMNLSIVLFLVYRGRSAGRIVVGASAR